MAASTDAKKENETQMQWIAILIPRLSAFTPDSRYHLLAVIVGLEPRRLKVHTPLGVTSLRYRQLTSYALPHLECADRFLLCGQRLPVGH